MSIMDKIQGIGYFIQTNVPQVLGLKADGYDDEEILDRYGIPEKVFISYDEDEDKTTVRLYEDGECYARKTVDGDRAEYYSDLYYENSNIPEEDIVQISTVKGGLAGKPRTVKKPTGLQAFDIDAQSKTAIHKALIEMQKAERMPRTYLDGPIKMRSTKLVSPKGEMSFCTFLVDASESTKILDHLEATDKTFTDENIETVRVSKDGLRVTVKTKGGKGADLNLQTGRRSLYTLNDEGEYGMPILSDANGPILKSAVSNRKHS